VCVRYVGRSEVRGGERGGRRMFIGMCVGRPCAGGGGGGGDDDGKERIDEDLMD
jgi:hypothetical protein